MKNSFTDMVMGDSADDTVQRVAQQIVRRRMATPALLFLVSHRPLSFVAGQFLYALQPIADLLNIRACTEFAAILSMPDGPAVLEAALTEAENQAQPVPNRDNA